MIVGMDGVFGAKDAAHDLDGPVRNHFVRIHVRLRTGPSLPDDLSGKMIEIMFSGPKKRRMRARFSVFYNSYQWKMVV